MLAQKLCDQTSVKLGKFQNPKGSQTEYCAIVAKKSQKLVLYYQPITEQMKKYLFLNQRRIFHPNDWSIQNFEVGRHLGRGKYGHVYLVKERKSKLIMALKVLSKGKILSEETMSQARRQLQIHSHLNHVNILSMYGFFFDQKKLYIMMQYSTNGDLYGFLKRKKRLEQKVVRKYMGQMVGAIHYLQTLNIMHRDLKPQNIMVSSDDTLKLSDFGWSIKSKSSGRQTFCGTPDYFCPQIIKYKPFDYKVDNWSLGILAYELLCGNPPFYAQERKRMYDNILKKEIVYPSFASGSFRDFVDKLTRKLPSQRMELGQALNHPWLREDMDTEDQISKSRDS